ncbi:PH domain-containing protein [Aquimarina rhabdastrellae]
MKFNSKKDFIFKLLVFGFNTIFIGMLIYIVVSKVFEPHDYSVILLLLLAIFLLFWVYFDTSYKLTNTHLHYRSGPLRGKIRIDNISEIIKGKTLWVGFKPATANHGLIIRYNSYNEIYISPESNDAFISRILEINPAIKIIL